MTDTRPKYKVWTLDYQGEIGERIGCWKHLQCGTLWGEFIMPSGVVEKLLETEVEEVEQ